MAITKLLAIKESHGRGTKPSDHLRRNIFYICNPKKTQDGTWVESNAGATPFEIYQKMMLNKQYYGKTNKRQGYHYVVSFPPELKISNELALQIAEEFTQELLGGQFLYCIALHTDKQHLHAHITFDSVNKETGYKYHSPKDDWKLHIQPITDRVCQKHGLPPLSFNVDETTGTDRGTWEHDNNPDKQNNVFDFDPDLYTDEEYEMEEIERRNKKLKEYYSWFDIVRNDIDEAIRVSQTYEEFMDYLEDEYYEVRDTDKNLTVTPYGRRSKGQGRIRTSRLGAGYTKSDIIERINNRVPYLQPEGEQREVTYGNKNRVWHSIKKKKQRKPKWLMTKFERRVYYWWWSSYYLLIPKKIRMTPEQRARQRRSVVAQNRIETAMCYVHDHDLESIVQMRARRNILLERKKALQLEYKRKQQKGYKTHTSSLMTKRRKLKKEYDETKNPLLLVEIKELEAEINKIGSVAAAEAEERKLWNELSRIRQEEKKLDDEIEIISDAIEIYYGEKPPIDRQAQQQEAEPPETMRERILKGNDPTLHRITINEKLFTNMSNDEYYVTRIPYKRNQYVKLKRSDCMMYQSGQILSAYIYDKQDYQIVNEKGEPLNTIKGSNLRNNYEDKTRTRPQEKTREH